MGCGVKHLAKRSAHYDFFFHSSCPETWSRSSDEEVAESLANVPLSTSRELFSHIQGIFSGARSQGDCNGGLNWNVCCRPFFLFFFLIFLFICLPPCAGFPAAQYNHSLCVACVHSHSSFSSSLFFFFLLLAQSHKLVHVSLPPQAAFSHCLVHTCAG